MVSRKIEIRCCKADAEEQELPPSVSMSMENAGGITSVLKFIPDKKSLKNMVRIHEALSEPIRIKILIALTKADLCPCLLKKITKTSDSKLSYHLKILRNDGLIESRKESRWIIYSITKKGLKQTRKE